MIIASDSTKQLIILELTRAWEERMKEANKKHAKYQELVRLANLLGASGGGLLSICRAITLQSVHLVGHHWRERGRLLKLHPTLQK